MSAYRVAAYALVPFIVGLLLRSCYDAGLQRNCIEARGNWDGSRCIIATVPPGSPAGKVGETE